MQVDVDNIIWDGDTRGFSAQVSGTRPRLGLGCKGMISDGLLARNRWEERSNERKGVHGTSA